jgi:hypothetical protein
MTVYCRQVVEDVSDDEYAIEPHSPTQTGAELLLAKANGATDKGWTVEWTTATSFTATKVRWGGVECVRTFEAR